MRRSTWTVVVTAAAATVLAGGAALASADDDPASPITGDALTHASEVALRSTGGGTVTGTEVGDEDSYYEVEVTLADGHQVDVQLDEQFAVVATTADHEGSGDD
ncbi:hypothetical protein Cch01nite_09700 [Cellulomonas chitinilytica]|uniref:PepSY domain-containing protein n=1 Tax=Cellulomonas chitinilytica TaxID=398759 RepID=A0A919NYY9_9CELL|nr:PepSY domain-containing protein [Cellulomonas chitinilytica]GIG20246.1 hypothetical protein Cch01nite_09700 [Cellulomonas chitinilytica]